MFQQKAAIITLVQTDPFASDAEKRKVLDAVTGTSNGCVRFREAARRLGVCTHTVHKLVKTKKLQGVCFTGQRPVGVTAESLDGYLARAEG